MGRHGESLYCSGDRSPEQMEEDKIRRYRERLLEDYSDSTRAMFTNFVLMHNEIKSLDLCPEMVAKYWWPALDK